VLCENVDKLALAFVAPLGPQHYRDSIGRQHLYKARVHSKTFSFVSDTEPSIVESMSDQHPSYTKMRPLPGQRLSRPALLHTGMEEEAITMLTKRASGDWCANK
jgi:hypothetical protein